MNVSERTKIVEAVSPVEGGVAAVNGDYISLKGAGHVTVVCHITQGNAATVKLSLLQATAVAGTGSKVFTNAVPIYANQDCAASDTLETQTAAIDFTTSATVKHKLVVFEVDAADLDIANGFDCMAVSFGVTNAANILQAEYIVSSERYHGESVITD